MRLMLCRIDARTTTYTLAIALGVTLDVTGALHVYGLSAIMGQRLAAGAALLLVVIAMGWLLVAMPTRRLARVGAAQLYSNAYPNAAAVVSGRLLTVLMLLAWLATAYDFMVFISPGFSLLRGLVFGGGALALLLAIRRPPAPGWLAAGAIVFGGAVRVASYIDTPIEPSRGDMLPLVQGALANFLSGRNPYTIYHMPWDLPLTYLPITWLVYLPATVLGLNIRLTNLLAELAISATLIWLAAVSRRSSGSWRATLADVWRSEPGLLLWAWMFLQPTTLNWSLATTAPVQWMLLCLTLALLIAGRNRWAALMLGLCAAASPLAAIIALFALLHWLRSGGVRFAALCSALAGLVAAMVILPFFIWSPQQFMFGTWRWFNDNDLFPRLRWEMDHTWARMVGFSGMFWRHSLFHILKPLQSLLLASLAVLYWRWKATNQQAAPFVVAALLLFTVFNPILWPYLYNPALIVALLAVISPLCPQP